jgi:class 3 adenylate cyclase
MPLEEFIEAGLYDPGAVGAAQRRELLEYLLHCGFTAAQIIETARRIAPITDVAVALQRPSPRLQTLSETAALCGAPTEEVMALRQALGFRVAEADAPDVPSTFIDDFRLYSAACEQYGRERVLAFAQVLGAAVMTLTEAARELFASSIRESNWTELQISQANEVAAGAWDQLPGLIGHLMVERTARDTWFEMGLREGHLVMAVGFVDLVASTEWSATTSSSTHAAALARFESVAVRLATTHGGRIVKFIGDEAMLVATEPEAATEIAVKLCEAVADDVTLPSARGAVGYGAVTARGGDYFGPVVNLASRATKAAAPDTVVVTTAVAEKLHPEVWSVVEGRDVRLRGLDRNVALVTVERTRPV